MITEDVYNKKIKYLHKKFFGYEDIGYLANPDYFNFLSNYLKDKKYTVVHEEIKCDVRFKNKSRLTINEPNICYNSLLLKIYNPLKKDFNTIFHDVSIDGDIFYSIYDSYCMKICNKVFNTDDIEQIGDFLYIPLCLSKEFLLYNNNISINLFYNKNVGVDGSELNPVLYGNKYIIEDFNQSNIHNISYYQYNDTIEPSIYNNIHTLILNTSHPTYLLYINNIDQTDVEKYSLESEHGNMLDITPNELIDINKKFDFDLNTVVFVFSTVFERYSDSTLNIGMFLRFTIKIHYKIKSNRQYYSLGGLFISSQI